MSNWWIAVLSTALGILATWILAHYYYKRQATEGKRLYDKLASDTRQMILEAKGTGLAIPDLVALLKNRVIDPESPNAHPHSSCPSCGSDNLDHHEEQEVDITGMGDDGQPEYVAWDYPVVECLDCGWKLGDLGSPPSAGNLGI